MSARVALVSSERGLRVDPDLPLAAPALREAGLAVDLVRWDDPAVDWARFDLAVVRSCWDYAWRRAEFLAWAEAVPRLRNPAPVLRWNTDKAHLRDLERCGLPVVPTVWDPTTAGELPDAGEWVVKPSVSAGSRDTARWSDAGDALAHAGELTSAGRTAMVQPYLSRVDDAGETALLFIGGRFSHAVRKGPLLARGEGVRQDRDSRGDLRPAEATPEQREVAQAVCDAVPSLVPGAAPLLYARIDLVADTDGRPVLLELELTEPSLFLPQAPPEALTRLARAVGDAIAA
ncbi:ATP-grasp domain-containing protein [Geodermatophilus maliterrae]|uniref:RimK family alpha-L-glutamate ligase n=1 Tax=Geodermatophilus maliterrae TaxID=3162531 RepID=A0ABV3XBL9_9ACTN